MQRAGLDGVEVGLVVDERVQRRDAHDLRQDLTSLPVTFGSSQGLSVMSHSGGFSGSGLPCSFSSSK